MVSTEDFRDAHVVLRKRGRGAGSGWVVLKCRYPLDGQWDRDGFDDLEFLQPLFDEYGSMKVMLLGKDDNRELHVGGKDG